MQHITRRQLTTFLAALTAPAPLESTETAEKIWHPQSIPWQRHDPDGTKYAVLHGDRANPNALFVYAFWMPPGVWVKAHTHTRDAHVAVLQGSLHLGFGAKMDKAKTQTLRAGDFFLVPGGLPHYEGSTEECLIIGTAQGGWSTRELE